MPQHIYLTGYRGTGKTSVGSILAKSLERPLIDLDAVIESRVGKTIREIFAEGGEIAFRNYESEALAEVADLPSAIISLGGGAILREENRLLIGHSGVCIWLDADAETLAERIQNDDSSGDRRPALTSLGQVDEIRTLLGQRKPLYQAASDHRVETRGKTTQQVADEVYRLISTGEVNRKG